MGLLKGFFIILSKWEWMSWPLKKIPGLNRMYKRFVAGEKLDDALEVTKKLNERNITVTLDHLGENVKEKRDSYNATRHYKKAMRELSKVNKETGMDNSISIKLTQIGLLIDKDYCYKNAEKIIKAAKKYRIRIEIDMESFDEVEDTIDIYRKLKKKKKDTAVCVQSYLYRTVNDVKDLEDIKPILRLVKGAYKESDDVSFQSKKEVDKNYKKLMKYMIKSDKITPLIGTHDEDMINYVTKRTIDGKIDIDSFEFETLYGIKNKLRDMLADLGFNIRVYTPYGEDWYPYFMRRLAERPANVFFLMKNLFKK